jgi:hypothetical protein
MSTIKTLRLTVTKPVKTVLDTLKKQYPTLSDTEILKLSLSETARSIESKNLLLRASHSFGYSSNTPPNDIFDAGSVKKYTKKASK